MTIENQPGDYNEADVDREYPDPNENNPNRQFPGDDSNVADDPIIPDKEDQIPVSDTEPSETSGIESDRDSSQSRENNTSQQVGSDKGGVYPYNINSNTSDSDDEAENGIEPKQGPLDTNEDQDFENTDQDSENSHI